MINAGYLVLSQSYTIELSIESTDWELVKDVLIARLRV